MNAIAARVVRRVLPFRRPLRTARGTFEARETLLLELTNADGLHGIGEAAPWPGFGHDALDASEGALHAALARLARFPEPSVVAPLSGELEPLLDAWPAARAAVEGALCDLAARRAGSTLAAWLAGQVALDASAPPLGRVPCSALLLETTPEAVHAEALRVRAAGYPAAKLKLGASSLADDLARAQAARTGLGPGIRLRGDANGAWTRATAGAAMHALAALDFDYVEQPVPAGDVEGLHALRGLTPVRVAADETASDEQGFRAVVENCAADLVVLKPALLGGPLRTLALAALARAAGVDVVFTHALDTAVGAWQAVHCAAAWADPQAVHGLSTAGLFVTDVGPAVEATHGFVTVPARPGLGFESWA